MGAVATPSRSTFVADPPAGEGPTPRLFEPVRSNEVSLEDVILGLWEDLTETGNAGCPVCAGVMHASGGCRDCGSELTI